MSQACERIHEARYRSCLRSMLSLRAEGDVKAAGSRPRRSRPLAFRIACVCDGARAKMGALTWGSRKADVLTGRKAPASLPHAEEQ